MIDDNDTRQAERQVAWALFVVRKAAFTREELRESYLKSMASRGKGVKDWTRALADFMERGHLISDGDTYSLSASGTEYADTLRGEDFGEVLVTADESKAHAHYCHLLYGEDLGQFSMVTMDQLEKLVEVLSLSKNSRVLDIGCGVGRITEYLSDRTGARVTGLDFAGPAVRRAQVRTRRKSGRLAFCLGSMNQLALPEASFDTIIAIDTLYFATDLHNTVISLKSILKHSGQLGLFWSEVLRSGQPAERLQPEKTGLADALSAAGLAFQTYDFTAGEKLFWQRSLDVLQEVKSEFVAEGNTKLYRDHLEEAERMVESVHAGRISRYLYHVQTV